MTAKAHDKRTLLWVARKCRRAVRVLRLTPWQVKDWGPAEQAAAIARMCEREARRTR